MRYVLGPALGTFDVKPTTPAPDGSLVDLPVTLIAHDDAGVTLRIDAYDPAVSRPAAEIRLYLVPEGQPTYQTADEYLSSPYAVTVHVHTPDPAGHDCVIPKPDVPAGRYLGQVVLGYEA